MTMTCSWTSIMLQSGDKQYEDNHDNEYDDHGDDNDDGHHDGNQHHDDNDKDDKDGDFHTGGQFLIWHMQPSSKLRQLITGSQRFTNVVIIIFISFI